MKAETPRIKRPQPSRVELLIEFSEAPMDAWFNQKVIAAVGGWSLAKMEKDRTNGRGIPFKKMENGQIRYQKSVVLKWLQQFPSVHSTAQADAAAAKGSDRDNA